ncbi:actin-associated protein FAM107A-like [Rhinatrema bivittatum]|uniref:actin-associated protein FAM107A-like n=1 Tax=Rhinatrema bivittatum TaxID=194408 RepID=UPI00112D47A4|nr:actin-associated protein FAM107A-like [Rhinatrema bivittatum]
MSQELWLWAKAQILSSLKPPQGLEMVMQDLRAASTAIDEKSSDLSSGLSSKRIGSVKSSTLVKASRTHHELHRELIFTHRNRGLALHRKPELLLVLEKRRIQSQNGEATLQSQTSLHQELQKWQQKREEKEQNEAKKEKGCNQELINVRQNLRRSPWHDPQLSHHSIN